MPKIRIELVDYKNRWLEYTDGSVRHFGEEEIEAVRRQCREEYKELCAELRNGSICAIVSRQKDPFQL